MVCNLKGNASAALLFLAGCLSGTNAQSTGKTTADQAAATNSAADLGPFVDLGYALYKPTAINQTGQYYNFSNIRYAAPPVGDLRWRAPQPPSTNRTVNDGSLGFICPQAPPFWFTQANTALGDLANYIEPGLSSQVESEDCLFLDVISPFQAMKPQRSKTPRKPLPVLVNIHGGGFWIGEKRALYWPGGLLSAANNGFVYVSMNYRLAGFGFLSNLQQSDSNVTVPNAGLLDQRFALKWVQKYIHLFGGDPSQVTITGESAGGASVQYFTTAYGGKKEANLFARGIAQSPAPLLSDPKYAPLGANLFLSAAGVSSADDARKVSTETLQAANKQAQNATPFNVVYFGPVIDNDLILDILPRSYSKGQYIKNVTMVTANNQDETSFLGNQSIKTDADFNNWVQVNFPSASQDVRDQILNNIYPSDYSGKQPYTSPQARSDLASKEYTISCNTVSIASAYGNKTHNYIFGIPPGIHAQDLGYTYYPNPDGGTPGFYPNIAISLQGYLTNFAITGNPNKKGLPTWPEFTSKGNALNLTTNGIEQTASDAVNSRCSFWNAGTYYSSP